MDSPSTRCLLFSDRTGVILSNDPTAYAHRVAASSTLSVAISQIKEFREAGV